MQQRLVVGILGMLMLAALAARAIPPTRATLRAKAEVTRNWLAAGAPSPPSGLNAQWRRKDLVLRWQVSQKNKPNSMFIVSTATTETSGCMSVEWKPIARLTNPDTLTYVEYAPLIPAQQWRCYTVLAMTAGWSSENNPIVLIKPPSPAAAASTIFFPLIRVAPKSERTQSWASVTPTTTPPPAATVTVKRH
jgi:hypothetical protein